MENRWYFREISTIWFLDDADFYIFLLNEINPRKAWNGNRGQKIDFCTLTYEGTSTFSWHSTVGVTRRIKNISSWLFSEDSES